MAPMNFSTSLSPAAQLFAWPLQFAQLSVQAFQAALPRLAPDALAQSINPGWSAVVNVNSNNSSAPETEQTVVARHSYGRQLGRLMDVVGLLLDDLQAREGSLPQDERIEDFRRLQADIDDIKRQAAERRLERIAGDLETLRRADEAAYQRLKARLRELVRD
jgi:hypothetical protein